MFMNVGTTVAAPPGGRVRHGAPGPTDPRDRPGTAVLSHPVIDR